MKVGDRVRIGRAAWPYGDLGNITTGLVGTVSGGPKSRSWGRGVNVRLSAKDLNRRMGCKVAWCGLDADGTVEMTFNADGVEPVCQGAVSAPFIPGGRS